MPFSITSVTPTEIPSDGGHKLEIIGSFEAGHRYHVHIGDTGTSDDPICHSGIAGQAGIVFPRKSITGGDLDLLTVYSPRTTPGAAPYDISVLDPDTPELNILTSAVTVVKRQFFTTVYSVRKLFSPIFKVGPRSINSEEPT
jgi:hypothetical protein